MLLYYPLEHVYYLLTHSIIPQKLPLPSPFNGSVSKPSGSFIDLDAGVISRLSTRFWGVYVLLQFAHLREDRRLLMLKERTIAKSKVSPGSILTSPQGCVLSGFLQAISVLAETEELKNRRDALWNELIVSLGYLPLTIHWCVLFWALSPVFHPLFSVYIHVMVSASFPCWQSLFRYTRSRIVLFFLRFLEICCPFESAISDDALVSCEFAHWVANRESSADPRWI